MLTFIPNNTGAGAQTSVVSAIQTAGETVPTVTGDVIEQYSKLRSVNIGSAMSRSVRKLDYR
jgi:hypothetical protein